MRVILAAVLVALALFAGAAIGAVAKLQFGYHITNKQSAIDSVTRPYRTPQQLQALTNAAFVTPADRLIACLTKSDQEPGVLSRKCLVVTIGGAGEDSFGPELEAGPIRSNDLSRLESSLALPFACHNSCVFIAVPKYGAIYTEISLRSILIFGNEIDGISQFLLVHGAP